MNRDYSCINCAKTFVVRNEAPPVPRAAEGHLTVECPYCGTKNETTWPQGAKYIVSPK